MCVCVVSERKLASITFIETYCTKQRTNSLHSSSSLNFNFTRRTQKTDPSIISITQWHSDTKIVYVSQKKERTTKEKPSLFARERERETAPIPLWAICQLLRNGYQMVKKAMKYLAQSVEMSIERTKDSGSSSKVDMKHNITFSVQHRTHTYTKNRNWTFRLFE